MNPKEAFRTVVGFGAVYTLVALGIALAAGSSFGWPLEVGVGIFVAMLALRMLLVRL
jgi:hypothetical protein